MMPKLATQGFEARTEARALLPERGPACGLGKGETGAVPGHGPAAANVARPTKRRCDGLFLRDGPLKDPAR